MVVATPTVARYDDLTGINRLEIGGWNDAIEIVYYDDPSVPGLVMVAPMRSVVDFWTVTNYKRGTLLLTPDLSAAPYQELHRQAQVEEPMRIYMPSHYKNVLVVNLQTLK